MEKISAVYQIRNMVTGDRYVGSSKDVKRRWKEHKAPYTWRIKQNSRLYKDMEKYGLENFRFQILAPVIPECLKQVEQEFIEMLKPTYNNYRANGRDVEKQRGYQKEYLNRYRQSEKYKEAYKKYYSQLCNYNGEILNLHALKHRFQRAGIPHATLEAKKYIIKGE
jgi:group I intron endonuclease